MSEASPDPLRMPASAMVYPDVYLPEDLARTVAERAEAAHITPGELLASLIERFVREHAGESRERPVAPIGAATPEDTREVWDAPGMVRRIVPLPEEVAVAVARLSSAWQRPINGLICDAVQAALAASDSERPDSGSC
jgi:hypothetical protein